MKDHVKIGHLTKYDAFRVNRVEVMDLEIWFKNPYKTCPILRQRPPKPYKFCDNCKIPSCTYYLKEAEMKITMFAYFKSITEVMKILRVYMVLGDAVSK